MEITFDAAKRKANIEKHGFDFANLSIAFFNAATVIEAREDRLMAIGWFGDEIVAVVFRPLGAEALSVISMRPASRKERGLVE